MEPARRLLPPPPPGQLAPLLAAYDAAVAAKRRHLALGSALLVLAVAAASMGAEVHPAAFWAKLGNFGSYIDRIATLDTGARVWTDLGSWFWGLGRWSLLIGETLLIAYVSTLTGAAAAVVGAVLASTNLGRPAVLRFVVRRVLEFCRTVPDIVFALIFVVAFGLGALPGVLAIAVHTAGTLGKLFAESIENIDMRPVEAMTATGASAVSQVRFGALPQVLPSFVSYALLRFEINVRGAAVIGFVGAGGIGETLLTAIRKFFYSDVSAILVMLTVCVILIDLGSERLRHRLLAIGGQR